MFEQEEEERQEIKCPISLYHFLYTPAASQNYYSDADAESA
jgi:hypothetical protein